MIRVLIVEDDPMVAELNRKYLNQLQGFQLIATAANTEEAHDWLNRAAIDLVLLDVYMPGENGLQWLKELRNREDDLDVILITAASEKEKIRQSLRLGVVDYLVKPFEFNRFQDALLYYQKNTSILKDKQKVNQGELDQIFRKNEYPKDKNIPLPKGLTKNTLEHIIEVIKKKEGTAFSTDDIAQDTGISRVSVRKYLKFLTSEDILEETLIYGVGRPVYQYHINGSKALHSTFYL